MKSIKNLIRLGSFALALSITALGQQPDTPGAGKPTATTPPTATEPTPGEPADKPPASPATKEEQSPASATAAARPNGETGLRLNFRGVPLEMVLII